MQSSSGQIKSAWIQQEEAPFPSSDHSKLRKTNIVANRNSDFTILRQIHKCDLVARREDLRFLEGDLPRDIYIEEVDFPMGCNQFSAWVEHKGCIEVLLRAGLVFGDTTAKKIRFRFLCEIGQSMKRRRLILRWRGWQKGFGVLGKVLATVRGVEAFWQDNQGSAFLSSFEDTGASSREVR